MRLHPELLGIALAGILTACGGVDACKVTLPDGSTVSNQGTKTTEVSPLNPNLTFYSPHFGVLNESDPNKLAELDNLCTIKSAAPRFALYQGTVGYTVITEKDCRTLAHGKVENTPNAIPAETNVRFLSNHLAEISGKNIDAAGAYLDLNCGIDSIATHSRMYERTVGYEVVTQDPNCAQTLKKAG